MKAAEHIGQLQLTGERQALWIGLGAEPHGALHEHVEKDVVLAEKLVNSRFRITPKIGVFRSVAALVLERYLGEGDGSEQRVRPDIERLAGQVWVQLGRHGDTPGHVARDRSMPPLVGELTRD